MSLSRILTPFQRLRWKLTFSYTLATVVAVLALEMVALLALLLVFSAPTVQRDLVQDAAATLAQEVEPFLSASPPDRAGLQFWLRQILPPQTLARSAPDIDLDSDFGTAGRQVNFSFGADDRMAILGRKGEVLAASAELAPAGADSGAPFADPQAPSTSRRIIDQALSGVSAATQLEDRTLLVAEPIRDKQAQVLGVVYLRIRSFTRLAPGLLGGALGLIGGSALLLTLGAGVVGTLFGLLVAHGFVRRLGALTHATEAWGRGDFAPTIHDTSADEIGQLARRLNRMAEEIENLLQARQELATLEERNRVARELHDSVKQQVFAATMTLGAAQSLWDRDAEGARDKVAEALALCRQAQGELSGLLHELRAVALEGQGLGSALQDSVERWSRQTGIVASAIVKGCDKLPLRVEQALFRVAQEALANVAKHSRAERAEVTLSCLGDVVILEVEDDGRGFSSPPAEGRGMGLRSMRERMQALGGDLVVDSVRGQGTRVTARCHMGGSREGDNRV